MKAVILTIGDELLVGQVVNTNAAWLGEKITALGGQVMEHLSVGDQESEILQGLNRAVARGDVVVVSGGLGPTLDDLTMPVVARFLGRGLQRDPSWLAQVQEYFRSRGREMPPGNEKMADLPMGAERLDNDCGTACGCLVTHQQKPIFVLPGVPYEMQSMFNREVEPRLKKREDRQTILMVTLQTTGIGESALAAKFTELERFLNAQTQLAFLPSPRGVRLRITATGLGAKDRAESFRSYLIEKSGKYFFSEGEVGLEEKVVALLAQKKRTISVAESCTGGGLAFRLTAVPGSSACFMGGLVAYDNGVKIRELQIPEALLREKGAVSPEVARAMAEGAQRKFKTHYGLGITGIAGPGGGIAEKPVGLVYIALAGESTQVHRYLFGKDRHRNRERACQAALDLVRLEMETPD